MSRDEGSPHLGGGSNNTMEDVEDSSSSIPQVSTNLNTNMWAFKSSTFDPDPLEDIGDGLPEANGAVLDTRSKAVLVVRRIRGSYLGWGIGKEKGQTTLYISALPDKLACICT